MKKSVQILSLAAMLYAASQIGIVHSGSNKVSNTDNRKLNHIMSLLTQYELNDIGRLDNVAQAREIAKGIKSEDILYKVAFAFAEYGNPARAVDITSRLTNDEYKYRIAYKVIERGNPSNGVWLLEKLQPEYQARGINLLHSTGNPVNALHLEIQLERRGLEHLILQYSSDEIRFDEAMSLARTGNPSRAVGVAKYIKDPEKAYCVAEFVIRRGNPSNGADLLKLLPMEYILKGVVELNRTGNPLNAQKLKMHLTKN